MEEIAAAFGITRRTASGAQAEATGISRDQHDESVLNVAGFDHLPPGIVPFAICRQAAAALIGVSPGFFDKLVKDGRMPQPRELDGRVLWDAEEVRAAWRSVPRRGQAAARRNSFDQEADT